MPRDFRDHRHLETAVPQFLDKGFGIVKRNEPYRLFFGARQRGAVDPMARRRVLRRLNKFKILGIRHLGFVHPKCVNLSRVYRPVCRICVTLAHLK